MGGRAALLHACGFKNKWDALVLISTHPGIEPENERSARREADRKLASEALKLGAGAFIQRWQEHPLIQSQKTIRPDWHTAMQATRKKHSTNGLATSLLEFGQGSTPNLWPKLKQLRLPVLLLSGSLDKTYRNYAERMQIKLPNATHQSVEGAGHMPHLEKPEVTAEILKNFVKGLE
ncbi:MAG: 2-succinyl-6-hydroxy-2,4-cyclohexadiene-1-carboxylate synthase [Opitutia bacterium UBA7350]|nr:MAG: 2-succinyl-6-hydroxy-2,4-cyclohexadiene-1-carboxylate synthase [Opitutae bacterium UBA7350]